MSTAFLYISPLHVAVGIRSWDKLTGTDCAPRCFFRRHSCAECRSTAEDIHGSGFFASSVRFGSPRNGSDHRPVTPDPPGSAQGSQEVACEQERHAQQTQPIPLSAQIPLCAEGHTRASLLSRDLFTSPAHRHFQSHRGARSDANLAQKRKQASPKMSLS